MKLGRVTNIGKGNKTTLKKLDDDAIWRNCDVIALFINSKLLSYKN